MKIVLALDVYQPGQWHDFLVRPFPAPSRHAKDFAGWRVPSSAVWNGAGWGSPARASLRGGQEEARRDYRQRALLRNDGHGSVRGDRNAQLDDTITWPRNGPRSLFEMFDFSLLPGGPYWI
jgi:hypothetical protein